MLKAELLAHGSLLWRPEGDVGPVGLESEETVHVTEFTVNESKVDLKRLGLCKDV